MQREGCYPVLKKSVSFRQRCVAAVNRADGSGPEVFGKRGVLVVADAVRKLKYPLSCMDFETLYRAIPRYAGMRPYDHIQFQWSVHRLRSRKALLQHFEFLAADEFDFRHEFIESLCRVLKGKGSIIVYNQSFASSRLSELAASLPDYAGKIARIQNRLWDLLPVIRGNVYNPRFRGSYSIKAVCLPALVPRMTYESMAIADGEHAGLAWNHLIHDDLGEDQRKKLRKALLAYCAQDTLAMVHLLDYLQTAAKGM
jgi:hypothetical protein